MYYTAICIDNIGKAYKYRNIKKSNFDNFEKFVGAKNIIYINYYEKQSKKFSHRKYLPF
jgi:hypothetical protein